MTWREKKDDERTLKYFEENLSDDDGENGGELSDNLEYECLIVSEFTDEDRDYVPG